MSGWPLRPLLASDEAALAQHCWPSWPPERRQAMLARAQKLADSERGLALVVAAYDEQAIAFGLLTYWPKIAELSDLIVAPDFRGLGIGAALIGALCEQAHRAGHSRAQIGVAEANHRALALYLRLGFEYERRLILKLEDEEEAVWYLLKSLG